MTPAATMSTACRGTVNSRAWNTAEFKAGIERDAIFSMRVSIWSFTDGLTRKSKGRGVVLSSPFFNIPSGFDTQRYNKRRRADRSTTTTGTITITTTTIAIILQKTTSHEF